MKNIRIENNLIVGTTGDKYTSKNPISKYLVNQFDNAIAEFASYTSPSTILEIGCGEGHVTKILLNTTKSKIIATEISSSVLEEAKASLHSDRISWEIAQLETYHPANAPEMVVCCEVLEHLSDPLQGLQALSNIQAHWYLLSVPREPIWRILNMMRGAYIKAWGNSPGHIHHWSKRTFIDLIAKYFEIVLIKTPLPWTIVLCRKRH